MSKLIMSKPRVILDGTKNVDFRPPVRLVGKLSNTQKKKRANHEEYADSIFLRWCGTHLVSA
jgi:hypothetical protein